MGALFGKIAATWIGKFADRIHQETMASWPWWTRAIIALCWDILVDIPTRIITGLFIGFFPGIMEAVRFPLDVILTLFGTALWGSHGLLQAIEVGAGLIPGVGWIIDLLPMLFIAGLFARRREQEEEAGTRRVTPPLPQEGVGLMVAVFLSGIVGLMVGIVLWWFEWIEVFSIIWVILGSSGAALVPPLARWIPVRRGLLVGIGILLLGIVAVNGSLLVFWPGAESYRKHAWEKLIDEKDLRIFAMRQADKIGKAVDISALKDVPGSLIADARKNLAAALEKTGEGEPEDEPYLVSFGKWLGKNIIKPEEKKKESPKPSPEPKLLQKDVERLGLGPAQASLYRSDFVLERAKEMRENVVGWFRTAVIWLGGLLAFIVIFGLLQNREATRTRIEPTIPF